MQATESETFGQYLYRIRKVKGYSLRALAGTLADLGVPAGFPYLSKLEAGSARPSDKLIEALATVLDVSKDELYSKADKVARDLIEELKRDPATLKLLRDRLAQKAGKYPSDRKRGKQGDDSP